MIMKKHLPIMVCVTLMLFAGTHISAQGFLKKLKDKAAQAAEKVVDKTIDKKVDKVTGTGTADPNNTNNNNGGNNNVIPAANRTSGSGKPSNKGGAGLQNTTPPDVIAQITEAETANNTKNFSDARYAIQQALMGVELQLGKQILTSLPTVISTLPTDSSQDRVMSTSYGWSNLTIQRVYKKDDQQLTINIGNSNIYAGMINMYFNNSFVQSNGDQQNVKQVRVKGNKALIQYDQSRGYTVLVPVGQTSIISYELINFANENDVMAAVNSFDIENIKKLLGEK
jgi:hypothetical protein